MLKIVKMFENFDILEMLLIIFEILLISFENLENFEFFKEKKWEPKKCLGEKLHESEVIAVFQRF